MAKVGWALAGALWLVGCGAEPVDEPTPIAPVDAVDPFIGTANEGNTYPGAVAPFGMASVSPHNRLTSPLDYVTGDPLAPSGYVFGEPEMYGFGLTHLSGVGCPDLGAPVVAATTGTLRFRPQDYRASYRAERASPGYYAVELIDEAAVEVTALPRVGLFRFDFAGEEGGNVLIDASDVLSWVAARGAVRVISAQEVEGETDTGWFCMQGNRRPLYWAARFDRPAASSGTWLNSTGSDATEQVGNTGAYFVFGPGDPVELYVGLSYVSRENAWTNLEQELGGMDFDAARETTRESWAELLGRVEVTGGSDEARVIFYTALYHALLHPNVIADVNGDHPLFGSDGVGRSLDHTRMSVFSLWDSYRNVHGLWTLLYPEQQLEAVRSLTAMAAEAGAAPMWELNGHEVNMMVGDPALPVVAETYIKGLTDFDVESVYPIMRAGALGDNAGHRPGGDSYRALGYVPMEEADEVWGPVSTTLEYNYADWALAQLARALGHDTDADALAAQAGSWVSLFDPQTGLLRPKHADGSFWSPFDPDALEGSRDYTHSGGPGYVEGTAWNYAFFVPHDPLGLAELHGGADRFVAKLEHVFDSDRFALWNEPDIAYPYLFTYLPGHEWRTARHVRRAMADHFGTGPDGIPGNDDCGTLSAWYLFSAIGLYPDNPASGRYSLGAPSFERVELALDSSFYPGERFVIRREGEGDVVAWELDGVPLSGASLTHAQLVAGGELVFRLE